MKKSRPATPPESEPSSLKAGLWIGGILVGTVGLIAWALWPQPNYTVVPVPVKKAEPFVMPDEKTAFAQYAGSQSCKPCHAAEFEKWQHSHHGLAERNPDDQLDLAAFEPTSRSLVRSLLSRH